MHETHQRMSECRSPLSLSFSRGRTMSVVLIIMHSLLCLSRVIIIKKRGSPRRRKVKPDSKQVSLCHRLSGLANSSAMISMLATKMNVPAARAISTADTMPTQSAFSHNDNTMPSRMLKGVMTEKPIMALIAELSDTLALRMEAQRVNASAHMCETMAMKRYENIHEVRLEAQRAAGDRGLEAQHDEEHVRDFPSARVSSFNDMVVMLALVVDVLVPH